MNKHAISSIKNNTYLMVLTFLLSQAIIHTAFEQSRDLNHELQKAQANLALYHAIINDNSSQAKDAITRSKANINTPAGTTAPLHIAATKAGSTMINTLLNLNANINAQDELGQTALMHAAKRCDGKALIQQLILRGANTELIDKAGRMTLDHIKRKTLRQVYLDTLETREVLETAEDKLRIAEKKFSFILRRLRKQINRESVIFLVLTAESGCDTLVENLSSISARL